MNNRVIEQLGTIHVAVSAAIETCLSTKSVSQINSALDSVRAKTSAAIASVSEDPERRRQLKKTRKALTVIDNLLTSLSTGLETRELKVKKFRALCANIKANSIPSYAAAFEAESQIALSGTSRAMLTQAEELQRLRELSAAQRFKVEEEQRLADESKKNSTLDSEGDAVARRLNKLRAMRDKLPTRMDVPYQVMQLPVVPNFETEGPKNPQLLDKLAIPYTEIPLYGVQGTARPKGLGTAPSMERYVILEQQFILLVSKTFIQNVNNHKSGVKEEETKRDFKEHRTERKALRYEIEVANGIMDRAVTETIAMKTKRVEIGQLNAQIQRERTTVKSLLRGRYSQDDKDLYIKEAKLATSVREEYEEIDKLQESYRTRMALGTLTDEDRENIGKKSTEFADSIVSKEKELKLLRRKLMAINKTLSNDATVRNANSKIEKMEKELLALQEYENKRTRLIPDAEAKLNRLHADNDRNEATLKDKRKEAKKAGDPVTPEDYARQVLATMNERSGSKYALVTPIPAPNPRNSRDILCFWIMPNSKLSAYLRATGGKAKVTQWDFPFESDRHIQTGGARAEWKHPSDDPTHPEFLEFKKNSARRPKGWVSKYAE